MDPKIDLKTILDLHQKWLRNETGGTRANLSGADLYGANLSGANLYRANLSRADLYRANLSGADLSRANLYRANLSGANLYGANLSGANLYRANLSGADLYRANLSGADLSRANLFGANLYGANLSEADLYGANLSEADLKECKQADLALAMTSHLPEGPFIGWKKCMGDVIVKLRIPEKAKRSHGCDRKCRAEFVTVLEVIGADKGISIYDKKTEYHPGKTVKANSWDENRWNTCGQGIHFFISRLEAEAFLM